MSGPSSTVGIPDWGDVAGSVQGHRRHGDLGPAGELLLQFLVACGQAEGVPVGVDHDIHEVRVAERRGRPLEGGLVEAPVG